MRRLIFRYQLAQRRFTNALITCNLCTRQPAAQRNPDRLQLKLFCVLLHLFGLVVRVLYAQVTGTKPLQVQTNLLHPVPRSSRDKFAEPFA